MANNYDKILKENLRSLILPLISKTLQVEFSFSEFLQSNLAYTVGREADAILKVKDKNGKQHILHVEFQSTNDAHMEARMLQYYAMIYSKYKLPVMQCVFYLGDGKIKMTNEIRSFESFNTYHLIDLKNISYKNFLNSVSPEEVILSILANRENDSKEEVIKKIFSKLRELLADSDLLFIQKIRQLEMLSILRNSRDLIINEENKMALIIDITKDKLFQKGEKQGIEKGFYKNKIQTATLLLQKGMDMKFIIEVTGLSIEDIDKLRKDNK